MTEELSRKISLGFHAKDIGGKEGSRKTRCTWRRSAGRNSSVWGQQTGPQAAERDFL